MNRQQHSAIAVFLSGLVVLTGCHPTQPFYLREDGDLSHYIETAQSIEHSDVNLPSLDEVNFAQAPLTLSDPEPKELWDLSLEEAIATTLANSKVIRQLGGAVAIRGGQRTAPENLLRFSDQANTVYQPALQSSNTLNFGGSNGIPGAGIPGLGLAGIPGTPGVGGGRAGIGGQGVEDALAAYDAHFSTSLFWDTTDRFQRPGIPPNSFLVQQKSANFQAQLAKRSAHGTEFFARANTRYNYLNSPPVADGSPPSFYTQEFEVEARRPLLRGSGELVNRIPIILARTNEDIVLADFEANVRNLVSDVESAYWDLYASYRDLEAAKSARDSLLILWRNAYAELVERRGTIQSEAQAREQYLSFRSQVEENYTILLTRERHLRFLMGLTTSDGRLIRPKDEPTTAHVEFEWCEVQAESLARSAELRRHKWRIKQRELELIYYRNQLLPQLDVVGLYRWVGVGDELINADRNGLNFPTLGSTAFDELTEGRFQEARVGVQLSPPQFGARRELSRIRHQQILLAESKAILEDLELNVLHRVTQAIVNADAEYHLAQTAFNRWVAAQQEVNARSTIVQQGGSTQEPNAFVNLLDSVRRQSEAQREYYQRLVNYNKAIADVHLAKGSLLEYDGVFLAEGPWPQKAYWDALGHARRRDASTYLNYGWTQPNVVSQGPTEQITDGMGAGPLLDAPMTVPPEAEGETIPTPPPSEGAPTEPLPLPMPTLPSPAAELPGFSLAPPANREAPKPNVGDSASPPQGTQFDWGDIDLGPPRNEAIRPAAAQAEVDMAPTPKSNAVQWLEPGGLPTASSSNWKSAIR
jgi:outer membrane protein TolC